VLEHDIDLVLHAHEGSAEGASRGGIGGRRAGRCRERDDWRRRWRREREATAEERQLEVRQATRLIEQELVEAEHLIIAAAKAKEYRRARRAPTATWNEWRPYLARHLGVADWRLVTMAFDAITDLNWLLDNREAEGRVRPAGRAG
jgi:hypothetical protein